MNKNKNLFAIFLIVIFAFSFLAFRPTDQETIKDKTDTDAGYNQTTLGTSYDTLTWSSANDTSRTFNITYYSDVRIESSAGTTKKTTKVDYPLMPGDKIRIIGINSDSSFYVQKYSGAFSAWINLPLKVTGSTVDSLKSTSGVAGTGWFSIWGSN
jgi:hypothetical protein